MVTKNKNNDVVNVPYLDEGIITQIFMRTPIESLYSKLRFVCKQWFDIIANNSVLHHNHQHLCQQPGLIVQYEIPYLLKHYEGLSYEECCQLKNPYGTYFFKLGVDGIEEQVDLTTLLSVNLVILSSCNGLLLAVHRNTSKLYVVNILTKQRLLLPPAKNRYHEHRCHLAFLPCTGEYKVVHTIDDDEHHIEILTLPSGSTCSNSDDHHLGWRLIQVPGHVQLCGDNPYIRCKSSIAINGILYWPHYSQRNITYFDISTETFKVTSHPDFEPPIEEVMGEEVMGELIYGNGGFVELDGRLSLVNSRPYKFKEKNKVDIWILNKDNIRADDDEWTKQSTLDIDDSSVMKYYLYNGSVLALTSEPLLNFRNGEVLILGHFIRRYRHPLLAYNVKSKRLWKLELGDDLYLDIEYEQKGRMPLTFYGSYINSIAPPKSLSRTCVV